MLSNVKVVEIVRDSKELETIQKFWKPDVSSVAIMSCDTCSMALPRR